MHGNTGYIVVGNFATIHDLTLDEIFNIESGLSERCFYALMNHFADENGLHIYARLQDTVIIEGTEQDYQAIRRLNGDRFSYALTDFNGARMAEQAHAESLLAEDGLIEDPLEGAFYGGPKTYCETAPHLDA